MESRNNNWLGLLAREEEMVAGWMPVTVSAKMAAADEYS
jgi:hypothetical protein